MFSLKATRLAHHLPYFMHTVSEVDAGLRAHPGLHNSFLMRPASVVVLLMPPEWCESAWQMANQAIASGLHVVAWCQVTDAIPKTMTKRYENHSMIEAYLTWAKCYLRSTERTSGMLL